MDNQEKENQPKENLKAKEVKETSVDQNNAEQQQEERSPSTARKNDIISEKKKSYVKKGRPNKKTLKSSAGDVQSEVIEKVIKINRVAKVTKGGKKLSFSALVVVGDTKGKTGYYLGKANDVAAAIRKSLAGAKKNMIKVPMRQSTITHEIIGKCGAARVLLKPAAEGTGVIAAGPVRAVCDAAGIHNILTKCHTTNNPLNVIKATIDGLSRLKALKTEQSSQGEKAQQEESNADS